MTNNGEDPNKSGTVPPDDENDGSESETPKDTIPSTSVRIPGLHWKTEQKLKGDLENLIASRSMVRVRLEERISQIFALVDSPPTGRALMRAKAVQAKMLERLEEELRETDSQISQTRIKLKQSEQPSESKEVSHYQELIAGAQFDLVQLEEPPEFRTGQEVAASLEHGDPQQQFQNLEQLISTPINDNVNQTVTVNSQQQTPLVVTVVQEKPRRAPKFNGDYSQFREWSQRFEIHVNSKDIPKISKFESLKECLTGAAKNEIAHIDFCEEQYDIALKRIYDVFGKQEDAEMQHVKAISNLFNATELHKHDKLRQFQSTLSQNILALLALGKTYESLSTFLVHNLTQVLPRTMQIQFIDLYEDMKSNNDRRCELEFLMDFLERQVRIQNKLENSKSKPQDKQSNPHFPKPKNGQGSNRSNNQNSGSQSLSFNSVAQHTPSDNSTKQKTYVCVFCSGAHLSKNCSEVLSLEERRDKITNAKACFRCLKRNHAASNCNAHVKCSICSQRHYPIMCSRQNAPTPKGPSPTCGMTTSPPSKEVEETSVLPTGFAYISSMGKKKKVRILLDPCSHRSYLSERAIAEIESRPIDTTSLSIGAIGGRVSDVRQFEIHGIELQSCFTPYESFSIRCLSIPEISKAALPLAVGYDEFSPVADSAGDDCDPTVELLLGADYLTKIETNEKRFINGIAASRTRLGWFFYGSTKTQVEKQETSLCAFSLLQPLKQQSCEVVNDNQQQKEATADDIEFLWSEERLGIEFPLADFDELSELDKELIRFFRDTVQRLPDGRYSVSLPFKENLDSLGDNENITRSRLTRLLEGLKNSPETLKTIDEEINDCIVKGFAEPATPRKPGEPAHYLPIQAIIKASPDHPNGKRTRIVKDASTRATDRASLNDVLFQGPSLVPHIFKVLLHFRRFKFVVTSDIQKAYNQARINPAQRKFLRFLWPLGISKDPRAKWKEFQSTSLDFGLVCSPFLHCQLIRHHLESEAMKDPEKEPLVNEIIETFYVDDLFTGSNKRDEAKGKIEQLFEIFQAAKYPLRKWNTNSSELADHIKSIVPFPDVSINHNCKDAKLLGTRWNQREDTVGVFAQAAAKILQATPSKRTLLKGLASIFDPIGIVSPTSIRAKILLQKLWTNKRDWDDQLKDAELLEYQEIADAVRKLEKISIPRAFTENGEEPTIRELHTFSDASLAAIACVSYVRDTFQDGNSKISFVASKARVAPLKSKQTIHRLELQGAVLATRLASTICQFMIPPPTKSLFYTDNAACLGWIREPSTKWRAYIANRVREIQNNTDPGNWSYVASADNPADIPSRGKDLDDGDTRQLWTEGPGWLKSPNESQGPHPLNLIREATTDIETERIPAVCLSTQTVRSSQPAVEAAVIEKYNSLPKIIRIWAFVRRSLRWLERTRAGMQRLRNEPITAPDPMNRAISAIEFNEAKMDLIRNVQKRHFPEEWRSKCSSINRSSPLYEYNPIFGEGDFIRCETRLLRAQNLSKEEKLPIILPYGEKIVKLMVLNVHSKDCLHSGGVLGTLHHLRKLFFVLKARRLTREVIKSCLHCSKFRAKPGQSMAPCLPEFRLETTAPFRKTSTDFAGPVVYKDENGRKRKGYILLFTCATVRGVHIELTKDMSTFEFLLAFRRFLSRFPTVESLLSDNGLTFKRAATEFKIMFKQLQEEEINSWFSEKGISWEFITEKSPWRGSIHERLIQVVKRPLRKILRQRIPYFRELETILMEIAAMVNSRPLTTPASTPDDLHALTPNDFIFPYAARTGLPTVKPNWQHFSMKEQKAIIFSKRHMYLQNVLDMYWKRFKTEYLTFLRNLHHQKPSETTEFAPGDVCLLHDESPNRATWPLCRIVSSYGGESTDGKKRSCVIRLANGKTLNRPTQLLYKLEL